MIKEAVNNKSLREVNRSSLWPRTEEGSESLRQVDVIRQLHANLAHLEDLSGRMHFMMQEIRSLMKERSLKT